MPNPNNNISGPETKDEGVKSKSVKPCPLGYKCKVKFQFQMLIV